MRLPICKSSVSGFWGATRVQVGWPGSLPIPGDGCCHWALCDAMPQLACTAQTIGQVTSSSTGFCWHLYLNTAQLLQVAILYVYCPCCVGH